MSLNRALAEWIPVDPPTAGQGIATDTQSPLDSKWVNGADIVILPEGTLGAPVITATLLAANKYAISCNGAVADKAYTLTLTFQVNASNTDQTVVINITENMTPDIIANSLVNALPAELKGTKTGVGSLTIELGTAVSIDSLSVQVA